MRRVAAACRKKVEAGAQHLRLAADAIGVLHPAVVLAVALADLRPREERPRSRGDLALAAVAAKGVDLGEERLGRPHDRVGRQGSGHDRALRRPPGIEQGGERAGGRELRAVEQGEALLRAEGEGRDSGRRERLPTRHAPAFEGCGPFADHHRREVRERREVAGRAHRALDGNIGKDAAFEHRFDARDERRPDAGRPPAEGEDLEGHHQPDVRAGKALPEPDAMRSDEVSLQGLDLAGGDANAGELPESGVDAVDGPLLGRARPEPCRRREDRRSAVGVEAGRHTGPVDALERGERRFAGRQRLDAGGLGCAEVHGGWGPSGRDVKRVLCMHIFNRKARAWRSETGRLPFAGRPR